MPKGRGYKELRKTTDPALKFVKQYDVAINYANQALKSWGGPDQVLFIVKSEKALQVISRNKLPMIPELQPLYRYFHTLLLKAEKGNKSALEEFIRHVSELKTTWILARRKFKENGFKKE